MPHALEQEPFDLKKLFVDIHNRYCDVNGIPQGKVKTDPRSPSQDRFDEIMSSPDEFRRATFDAALNPLMQRMFLSMVNNAMERGWHPKSGLPENPSMGQYIAMEVWSMAGGGK